MNIDRNPRNNGPCFDSSLLYSVWFLMRQKQGTVSLLAIVGIDPLP